MNSEQAGEPLRYLLVRGVPGAGDHLHLTPPQRRHGELAQVVKVHQLLAGALEDGQRLAQFRDDRDLVGEPALTDAGRSPVRAAPSVARMSGTNRRPAGPSRAR